jgi:uncharacterized protein
MSLRFDCHPDKRALVLRERGIDLLDMAEVLEDPRRVGWRDVRHDYGEERFVVIGRAGARVFTVVYTLRGDIVWLVTAWPSSRKERGIHGE